MRLVEELSIEELERRGGFTPRRAPLLVRGAVKRWPAWERWTFEKLAALRRPDGSEVVTRFQNGLIEQGTTREPLKLAVAPYLRELAAEAQRSTVSDDVGLLPWSKRRSLTGASFGLDWSYLRTFEPHRAYLAQWYVLDEFPALKRDFAIRTLWPGSRLTWAYTFIGPKHTVTGLHYDDSNNWFCQVTGVKEFLLFDPDQSPYLSPSRKYDWGATLSDVDITRLGDDRERSERFAAARGWYARVEPGDALFVPKRSWHAVVSLAPSISLAVFGLNPWEVIVDGATSQLLHGLHLLRLHRWGNCTCHETSGPANALE